MPKKKAQGAISRTQLVITHSLLSDPEAVYADLGTDYYEQRTNTRREVRSHARAIERRRLQSHPRSHRTTTPTPKPPPCPVTKAS